MKAQHKLIIILLIMISVLIGVIVNLEITKEDRNEPNVLISEMTPLTFGFHVTGTKTYLRFGKDWYKSLAILEENGDYLNCLLQTIATEPKAKEDIIANCGINQHWLSKAVEILKSHNCLGENPANEYYSKVPILTEIEMKRMQESLTPIARSIAKRIKCTIPEIKQKYNDFKSDSDPSWEVVAHFIIDKLLLDGQFHLGLVKLEKENGFRDLYSQDQKKIPAWFLQNYTQYGTFGSNWYSIKNNGAIRDIYYLHGSPLMRFKFPVNHYKHNPVFKSAIHKIDPDGTIAQLSAEEIQILNELHWIDRTKLLVPLISYKGLKKIYENELKDLGFETAQMVCDNFSVIINIYNESPYAAFSSGAGDYIQVCYHLLFTGIINELIKMDAIPPVTKPCPDYFGVYITVGSLYN